MSAGENNPFLRIRSVIETPVLDARKWRKLPSIPADAVLCDMEDAVPSNRKVEGRAAVVQALQDIAQFGDRVVLARCNDLSTPWGREDVIALAMAQAPNVMLPKVCSRADVDEYRELLNRHDVDPELIVCVETPGAVARVEDIVAHEKVRAVAFGEGDLTARLRISIYGPDGELNKVLAPARARVYLAAAAENVARLDAAFVADVRDLSGFRARAEDLARMSASGMVAIYPPHVQVINETFAPTSSDVANAQQVVAAFESATEAGAPAVQVEDGRVLLIHDYQKALSVLSRVQSEPAPSTPK